MVCLETRWRSHRCDRVSELPELERAARRFVSRFGPVSVKARSGFTLLELVVVLAILGAIGGTIGTLLLRQQRFYRGASELLYAREGVRDALEVLATDIRGVATADTVRLLADSANAPGIASTTRRTASGTSATGAATVWVLWPAERYNH